MNPWDFDVFIRRLFALRVPKAAWEELVQVGKAVRIIISIMVGAKALLPWLPMVFRGVAYTSGQFFRFSGLEGGV